MAFADVLPIPILVPTMLLIIFPCAALPPRRASNAPTAVRSMVANSQGKYDVELSYGPGIGKLRTRSSYFGSSGVNALQKHREPASLGGEKREAVTGLVCCS